MNQNQRRAGTAHKVSEPHARKRRPALFHLIEDWLFVAERHSDVLLPKKFRIAANRQLRSSSLPPTSHVSPLRSEERRVGKESTSRSAPYQAEDGIRDTSVTGVQTCALPIYRPQGIGAARQKASPSALPSHRRLVVCG